MVLFVCLVSLIVSLQSVKLTSKPASETFFTCCLCLLLLFDAIIFLVFCGSAKSRNIFGTCLALIKHLYWTFVILDVLNGNAIHLHDSGKLLTDPVMPSLEGNVLFLAQKEQFFLRDRKDNVMLLTGLSGMIQLLVVLDFECEAAQTEEFLLRAALVALQHCFLISVVLGEIGAELVHCPDIISITLFVLTNLKNVTRFPRTCTAQFFLLKAVLVRLPPHHVSALT